MGKDKTFVVKVQRSITTNMGCAQVLVYNQTRTREQQFPMTKDLQKLFPHGEFKVYHRARMNGTVMELLNRVPDPPW